MRIVVPVVVEMNDEQVREYASDMLGITTGRPDASALRYSVKRFVVELARNGADNVGSGFQVSLKGDDQ